MEDESKYIYINNNRYCEACLDLPERHRKNDFNHAGVREVITKEGMLIPTPGLRYANLHPRLTRHLDSLTSTDQRINQGADYIDDAIKERISETKDSQMKCLNLIPEIIEDNQIKEHPKKPKAHLSKYTDKIGICPFYSGKSFITTTSDSYRNIMQAANLINLDKKPRSITATDYIPKVLYPFNTFSQDSCPLKPKCEEGIHYRKSVSVFSDLEVPKKYGYFKFADDMKPTV